MYLKQHEHEVPGSGKLRDAVNYALNQEKYLKVFLEDGEVPIDNKQANVPLEDLLPWAANLPEYIRKPQK